MTKVITSGFFNPIHKGHIDYLQEASKLGDLIVIVNTDQQVAIKGSTPFQDLEERMKIVEALYFVDEIVPAVDEDGSVCKTIEKIVSEHKDCDFIFAKGGDRTLDNIPEKEVCERLGVKMQFMVGGEKTQSSSDLLNKIKQL